MNIPHRGDRQDSNTHCQGTTGWVSRHCEIVRHRLPERFYARRGNQVPNARFIQGWLFFSTGRISIRDADRVGLFRYALAARNTTACLGRRPHHLRPTRCRDDHPYPRIRPRRCWVRAALVCNDRVRASVVRRNEARSRQARQRQSCPGPHQLPGEKATFIQHRSAPMDGRKLPRPDRTMNRSFFRPHQVKSLYAIAPTSIRQSALSKPVRIISHRGISSCVRSIPWASSLSRRKPTHEVGAAENKQNGHRCVRGHITPSVLYIHSLIRVADTPWHTLSLHGTKRSK